VIYIDKKDMSVAGFCRQVAARTSDTFCNFYLTKNHKIATMSTTIEAKEKISTAWNHYKFRNFLCMLQYKLNFTK